MRTKKLAVSLLVSCLVVTACGKEKTEVPRETSAKASAPLGMPAEVNQLNLAELMKAHPQRVVTHQPWAGYWWPYSAAGVSNALYKYDQAYIKTLESQGRNTNEYQWASQWEAGYHGPSGLPKMEGWFGHCNGWAASAIMVPEPRRAKTVNGIEFDVEDQKALLAESWLEFSGDFVGTRVDEKGDFSSAAFWDVAPAQFHLILGNIMGKQDRALIIDRHTGSEIWNQPVVAYKTYPITKDDYLGAHPSTPEVYRVNVTTSIWWANDNVEPNVITPPFDLTAMEDNFYDYHYPGRKLRYELWLNGPIEFDEAGNMVKSGDILVTSEDGRFVGGVWKNGTSPEVLINTHPDFMWVPYGIQKSTGYKNIRVDDNWVRDQIAGPVGR